MVCTGQPTDTNVRPGWVQGSPRFTKTPKDRGSPQGIRSPRAALLVVRAANVLPARSWSVGRPLAASGLFPSQREHAVIGRDKREMRSLRIGHDVASTRMRSLTTNQDDVPDMMSGFNGPSGRLWGVPGPWQVPNRPPAIAVCSAQPARQSVLCPPKGEGLSCATAGRLAAYYGLRQSGLSISLPDGSTQGKTAQSLRIGRPTTDTHHASENRQSGNGPDGPDGRAGQRFSGP